MSSTSSTTSVSYTHLDVYKRQTQIENRLRDHFYNVVTIHSGLSIATRKKLWMECLEKSKTTPLIIIGARSALFTPLHNLGLIIVDEEHEPSYKQESSPRYDAITVAAQMSRLTKAKLVLGSATPSLRSYYLSKKNICLLYTSRCV